MNGCIDGRGGHLLLSVVKTIHLKSCCRGGDKFSGPGQTFKGSLLSTLGETIRTLHQIIALSEEPLNIQFIIEEPFLLSALDSRHRACPENTGWETSPSNGTKNTNPNSAPSPRSPPSHNHTQTQLFTPRGCRRHVFGR